MLLLTAVVLAVSPDNAGTNITFIGAKNTCAKKKKTAQYTQSGPRHTTKTVLKMCGKLQMYSLVYTTKLPAVCH